MTGILTCGLPDCVELRGEAGIRKIPVETDFRLGILMQELAEDETLDEGTRMALVLRLYCGGIPEGADPAELYRAVLDFYAMKPVCDREDSTPGEPVLDFALDGNQILASFQWAYGIDLLHASLHWWHFMALLLALPPETPLMQTIRIRTMDIRQIQDDDLRKRMRRAKSAVRIRKKKPEGPERNTSDREHKEESEKWQTEV